MSDTQPTAKLMLREIYAIDVEPDAAVRIDGALLGSGRRLLDILAKDPVPVDGFEEPAPR